MHVTADKSLRNQSIINTTRISKNLLFLKRRFCSFADLERSGKSFTMVTETIEGQPGLCLVYLKEADCEEKVQIPDWFPSAKPAAAEVVQPGTEEKKVGELWEASFLSLGQNSDCPLISNGDIL